MLFFSLQGPPGEGGAQGPQGPLVGNILLIFYYFHFNLDTFTKYTFYGNYTFSKCGKNIQKNSTEEET